jgi:two-component system, LuxR family, sensor kinase FixL
MKDHGFSSMSLPVTPTQSQAQPQPQEVEYSLPPETTLVEEKTRALFTSIPVSLASSILLATILSSSQWNILDHDNIVIWNTLMLATMGLRSLSLYLWRNYLHLISSDQWLLVFRTGVLLTGTAWGSSALFMFAHANPTYQALLAFTLAGLSSGALTTLAVDKLSAMGFVILAIMPLSLRLFAENGPIAIPMGAMSSLYVLFVISASSRAYKNLLAQHNQNNHLIAWGKERINQQQMSKAIGVAQADFIKDSDSKTALSQLLKSTLELTESPYGFIGEILKTAENEPSLQLVTFSSLTENPEFAQFCEKHPPEGFLFTNMHTLFGAAIVSGAPVISNQAARDPRAGGVPKGHPSITTFLGIPIYSGATLVAILCLANRANGYDEKNIEFLKPATNTIAQFFEAIKHAREQKAFEQKIQNNAKHTQAILDEVFDAIITLNQNGAIQSLNKSAEMLFSYAEQEVLNLHINQLIPEPPSQKQADTRAAGHLSTQVFHYALDKDQELTGIDRNGKAFPIDFAISAFMRDKEIFYIGVARDISERKRNEELKNQFISTVSHELRTPLTSIVGALGILNSDSIGALNESQKKITAIALQNSFRLQALVDDLLDMEKLLANKMELVIEPHCIVQLVKKSIEVNQIYAEKHGVHLRLVGNPSPKYVLGDSFRIQQVLANLISNAAKFSNADSTVNISISSTEKTTRVSVADNGRGILEEFRLKIFERFSQIDGSDTRKKGGSGLGLAISKELIERMGGKIDFSSVLGKGSCFYFDLPSAEKPGTHEYLTTTEKPHDN